jgi:hypothetical protein
LSDLEPIVPLRPVRNGKQGSRLKHHRQQATPFSQVAFDRHELNTILSVYGRFVATGEWRDYAINFSRERAVFSIYKRTSECPLYRVEKTPKLARKQGAFCVSDHSGRILKRGHELAQVLKVFDKKPRFSVV